MNSFRIGHGYDIHRFEAGRPLILGGVNIPFHLGLLGHSDADCLTHALADALLGALALPDIGHLFPNNDPACKGMDSQIILKRAASEIRARGYEIANLDASIIAQAPKIAPHIAAMRQVLSTSAGIAIEQVSIKATTNEGLDDLGRTLGIAAHAVALVYKV